MSQQSTNYAEWGIIGLILAVILGGGYALLSQDRKYTAAGAVKPCGTCGGTQEWLKQ